jgi:hypothetical protein
VKFKSILSLHRGTLDLTVTVHEQDSFGQDYL